jgi:hypothetical protein
MSQEIKHLFRKKPSLELVNDILQSLKFSGTNDSRLFTKNDISVEAFEEFLPQLDPYYLPCKSKLFLRDFDSNKAITVLRHLLRAHGYKLHAYEKVNQGAKMTYYQFERERLEDLSGSLCVDFT